MQRLVCILDIDETLVYSRHKVEGSSSFTFEGDNYLSYTKARPGALEILETLKDRNIEVCSVTQGVIPFQREVLHTVELLGYFQNIDNPFQANIFGWETVSRTSIKSPGGFLEGAKWVMVDNLHHRDPILWEKQNWIGAEFDPEVNFVEVQDFLGDSNCPSLMTYLSRIEELLHGR